MKLSELTLRNLKPHPKTRSYADDQMDNLHVIVTPRGTKTFSLVHYVHGKRTRTKIGRYGIISLKQAREIARKIQAEVTLGNYSTPSIQTLEQVFDVYKRVHLSTLKPTTAKVNENLIRRHFHPLFPSPIHAIQREDIIAIVDGLSSTPSEGNHAFARIREMMNWCVRRGYIEVSPCLNLKKPYKEKSRDRVLSIDELKRIKTASHELKFPFGYLALLLMYTACRRDEIASLEWSFLKGHLRPTDWPEVAVIPDTKNTTTLILPLSAQAQKTLFGIPKIEKFVFPSRNDPNKCISGFSYGAKKLKELSGVTGWTMHDFRRSAATHIAEMGTPQHVIDRILNHTKKGVSGTYNRYHYFEEAKEALQKYSDLLE